MSLSQIWERLLKRVYVTKQAFLSIELTDDITIGRFLAAARYSARQQLKSISTKQTIGMVIIGLVLLTSGVYAAPGNPLPMITGGDSNTAATPEIPVDEGDFTRNVETNPSQDVNTLTITYTGPTLSGDNTTSVTIENTETGHTHTWATETNLQTTGFKSGASYTVPYDDSAFGDRENPEANTGDSIQLVFERTDGETVTPLPPRPLPATSEIITASDPGDETESDELGFDPEEFGAENTTQSVSNTTETTETQDTDANDTDTDADAADTTDDESDTSPDLIVASISPTADTALDSSDVAAGSPVTFEITVRNTGGETGEKPLTVSFADTTKSVTEPVIHGGKSDMQVTFTAPSSPGTYDVTAEITGDSKTTTTSVSEAVDPEDILGNDSDTGNESDTGFNDSDSTPGADSDSLTVNTVTASPGTRSGPGTVTVTGEIENTGNDTVMKTARFFIKTPDEEFKGYSGFVKNKPKVKVPAGDVQRVSETFNVDESYFSDITRDGPTVLDVAVEMHDPESSLRVGENIVTNTSAVRVTDEFTVSTWHDLDAVRDYPSGEYTLTNDLTPSTDGYSAVVTGTGDGFTPIGANDDVVFTGTFDGDGHTISGLQIDRPETSEVGLFSRVEDAVVRDVTLQNADVTGFDDVGAVAGYVPASSEYASEFVNVDVSGSVTGNPGDGGGRAVGGVAGYDGAGSTFTDVTVSGTITGTRTVGGVVGSLGTFLSDGHGLIERAHVDATVRGGDDTGGIAGENSLGEIRKSTVTGTVTGVTDSSNGDAGGIVGSNTGDVDNGESVIEQSYVAASVTGDAVAGIAGSNSHAGVIRESWVTGSIKTTSSDEPGVDSASAAVVLRNDGRVRDVYVAASGGVSTLTRAGDGSVSDSYFDASASSVDYANVSDAVNALNTSEMTGRSLDSTFESALDFTGTWRKVDSATPGATGDGYPVLRELSTRDQADLTSSAP